MGVLILSHSDMGAESTPRYDPIHVGNLHPDDGKPKNKIASEWPVIMAKIGNENPQTLSLPKKLDSKSGEMRIVK